MELRWWSLVVAGTVLLVIAVLVAWFSPMVRVQRSLRPLAHVHRLTRLPEYLRVYRVYLLSVVVTGVLLVVTFGAALVAAGRPVGSSSSTETFDAAHPEDIMLCVGQPVTDPTTAGFLDYYAQRAKSSDTQRLGLTSPTLRIIPLTRDTDYISQRLTGLTELARLQQDLDTGAQVSAVDRDKLATGTEAFSHPVGYVDYAQSVEDILALCMTGFPSFESKGTHRRQLIYVGYTDLRGANEQRRSLFSTQSLQQMASAGGIQLNILARSDVVAESTQGNDALRSLVESTGGRFSPYNPAGAGLAGGGTDPALSRQLDLIGANPPSAQLPGGQVITSRSLDSPGPVLIIALVAAGILSVSLAVLRR
ncbi:hypothetical protein [Mycolicibacterium vinylchloridicum]|uniref:hypothetical protein n=1 Tax=Mycolicibacterium vinylchloridicum TaxID=2736928 RepID=UPI0015CB02C9|nr:hypothetical protein [Mycolicibacterium vinylchloridicum]